ncbi:uncharacterized protein LOC107644060 [Arachis ipaensis]|uniref:DUF3741 domain-containing protein n=1 Tax=Arachis hypogaea TaxID=3818 RepID=A0A444Z1U0_ARAHY|nr:uncharacterized protein LOC107644060 [Arachis ipaensis]XP_025653043.1 uncharacterized protein LOC112748997 [Arachis hypogaea]QHO12898.1 uncharacterized protein DS421_15g510880 [Arachis hypogaea]RYR08138.1 hypothetical protein Ahy_B05g075690 [Arachis hypogaea]
MAKRSDFAQKLLDDLRLRKEKMGVPAASHQSQRTSQSQPIDAYSYSKQTSVGSRNRKSNEIVSSRNGDMLNRSSRSHRSSINGEVSNQIVSYGRGQSSHKMDDVSLAIAFAFENGMAKPRRTDSSYYSNNNNSSTLAFLHQIKKGTMEFGMMDRQGNMVRQQASTNNFQGLSPMQINEISKGAQRLNQILRACSNGFNIDRYSIEVAKELFQGAIDLEQSLRMLVELQQNSEFLIAPQKKNRIKLLDEDSEDDDESNKIIRASEKNQLAPPIFSFDKRSRHTLMQGKIILTNSKEGRNSNTKNKDGKISRASQKQTNRSSSEIKNLNDVLEQKSHSASAKSDTEKGRIPSVVAKLMGLDNLPEKAEPKIMPQKDSGNAHKIRGNQGMSMQYTSAKERTKKVEVNNNKETENLVAMKKQRVIEAFNMAATTHDEEQLFAANKNSLGEKAGHRVVSQSGKPLWSDLYGIKPLNGFEKPKHNISAANITEQKSTAKGRINGEQVNERSQVKPSMQEEKDINVSNFQMVKKNTYKQNMNNQKKPEKSLADQKSYMLTKYGPQEGKNHSEQRLQPREKQMPQARLQGGSELNLRSSKNQNRLISSHKKQNSVENLEAMKLEGLLGNRYDDFTKHETSNGTNDKVKEIVNRKGASVKMMVDEKIVPKLANMKVKNTRKQKADMPRKIVEVSNEGNGRKLIEKVKQQIHILHDSRQGEIDRFNGFKDAKGETVGIINSNETAAVAESPDRRGQPLKEADLAPTSYNSDGRELHSLKGPIALTTNHSDHAAPVVANEGFKRGELALNTTNGTHEESMSTNNNHLPHKNQNIYAKRTQKPLTESEIRLKRILVANRSFLNTSEALFRLNIPFSILQDGSTGSQDREGECKELMLDCGYEVMKRKGILSELRAYPFSNISIDTMSIASLDDLVRLLNKDIEKLRFYGRNNRNFNANVEDYLPKMLELDIFSREQDIDCMWDFGWKNETFALIERCDVVKDMEKHVLNVLLDEITRELMLQGGLKMATI